MGKGTKPMRWIAMLLAVVVLASACGEDGDDSATDNSASDNSASDDSASDNSAQSADPGPDSGDSGSDDTPAPGTALDCEEVQSAVDAAADLAAIDPTGGSGPEELEAGFEQSRASLAALGEASPEISDAVDKALAGYDELGSVFAELDWDLDFSSDPTRIAEVVGAMNNADILGMTSAMQEISAWIATSCTS